MIDNDRVQDTVALKGAKTLQRSEFVLVLVLIATHTVLSIYYALTIPAWEGYDESGHYGFARYIAVNSRLPPTGQTVAQLDETHQPPLYYWLVAQAISGIDVSDDRQADFLWAQNVAAKPDPLMNALPYTGTALALRAGRLISVAISTAAVLCTYFTARTLFPDHPRIRLIATALHAFWPMALFISGLVNNDNGIALTGSLVLLFSARLVASALASTQGKAQNMLPNAVALGVSCGVATLMKDSAVAQLAFAVIASAWAGILWVKGSRRSFTLMPLAGTMLAFVASAAIVIALGVLASDGRTARQFAVASSLSSAPTGGAINGNANDATRPTMFALQNLGGLNALNWFFESFFGLFGWGGLPMPRLWYALAKVSAIVSAIGLIIALVRGCARWQLVFLLSFIAVIFAAPATRYGLSSFLPALNGRFTLPALGAITIVISAALLMLPYVIRNVGSVSILAGVLLVGTMCPDVIIRPVYSRPPILFLAGETGIPNPTSMTFTNPANGDAIELIGYDFPEGRATRGGYMAVRLFWRAPKKIQERYSLLVEAFDSNGKSLGSKEESQPARGAFDTMQWKPNDVYAETHYLTAWDHVSAPLLAVFRMTWQQSGNDEPMSATCLGDASCSPVVGLLPVSLDTPSAAQWQNKTPAYILDQIIEIMDVSVPSEIVAGQPVTVSLVWRGKTGNLPMLTAFAHLISADDRLVAQADSPPRFGLYPTPAWKQGDLVPDELVIQTDVTLPPGEYSVKLGMYEAKSVQRLSMTDNLGAGVPNGAANAGRVTVLPHR